VNKTVAIVVVAVLLVAVIAGVASTRREAETGPSRLVVVTMPGVSEDVSLLLEGCDVEVVTLVEPGVDPHTYNLEPSKAALLDEADLVVSTGHTPLEENIQARVPAEKLLVIPEIEGVRVITVDGVVNLHGVQYDPDNLLLFLQAAAARLASIYPDCNDTITQNLAQAEDEISQLKDQYQGLLSGRTGVVSDPAGLYALEWLGPDLYLVSLGHDVPVTPSRVEEARRLLAEGAFAAVLVAETGPATAAGEWLTAEAEAVGAPILRVPAPYTPGTTLSKLEQVAREAVTIVEG